MKRNRISIRKRSAGCVEVTAVAPNGSWIAFDVYKFSRTGNVSETHHVVLDLYSATEISRAVQRALDASDQHLERLKLRALNKGY